MYITVAEPLPETDRAPNKQESTTEKNKIKKYSHQIKFILHSKIFV